MSLIKQLWQRILNRGKHPVTVARVKESGIVYILLIDRRAKPIPLPSMSYSSMAIAAESIALTATIQSGHAIKCDLEGHAITISDA